jgi:uncharacterized protein YqhQ
MNERLPNYGGQAVIEGVMMRGANACAIAVRAPDGSVEIETRELGKLYRSRISKVPFVRGLVVLWDALVLGTQALTYSANIQIEEEEEKIDARSMALSFSVSFVIMIGVFILFPAGLAYLMERYLAFAPFLANALEGVVRLLLLIGYIWLIGRLPDIQRVFAYHGAEHKTIHAFEEDAPLEPDQVMGFPRQHPRCGTGFLLTVVVLSILLFSALGPMPLVPRMLSRIALVPILAALAYEYIRLTARFSDHAWARWLMAPNLWLQNLTTREPDASMVEVALAAFDTMRAQDLEPPAEQGD